MEFVYIFKTEKIDDNDQYIIKIGRSYNVTERMKQIQTSNPYKISLIQAYKCNDCCILEKMVHNYYKEKRLEGEWFKFTEQDINECKELISKFIIKIDQNTCKECKFATYYDEIFENHKKHHIHEKKSEIVYKTIDTEIINNTKMNIIKRKIEYKCDKCGKIFNHKNDYNRHLNRKNPCKTSAEIPIQPNFTKIPPNKIINDLKCNYCEKIFTRSDSLNRHLQNRCKVKKRQDKQKEEEELMTKLIQKKDEQAKQMTFMIKNVEEMKKKIEILEKENCKCKQQNKCHL